MAKKKHSYKRVSAAEAAEIFKAVEFRGLFGQPTYVRAGDAAAARALLAEGERELERQRRGELIAGLRETFGLPAAGGRSASRGEVDALLRRLNTQAQTLAERMRRVEAGTARADEALVRQVAGNLSNDIATWLSEVARLSNADQAAYDGEVVRWSTMRAGLAEVIAEAGGNLTPGVWAEADDSDSDDSDGADLDFFDDDGPPPAAGPRLIGRMHGAGADDFDHDLAESADAIAEQNGTYTGPITIGSNRPFAGAKV